MDEMHYYVNVLNKKFSALDLALWPSSLSVGAAPFHIKEGIMIIASRKRSKVAFALCPLPLPFSIRCVTQSDLRGWVQHQQNRGPQMGNCTSLRS